MIMFYLALIVFTLIFLIIATISDIKSREVSNKLILVFLVFGFVFKIMYGVVSKNTSIIWSMLLSVTIAFVFFYILWELGVIAGGDLKLFLVLAVLVPNIALPFNIPSHLFPEIVFLISLFMVIPWILVYSLYFIFKKKYYLLIYKHFIAKDNLMLIIESTAVVFLISLIYSLFSKVTPIIILVPSFIFTIFIFKIKNKRIFYSVLLGLSVMVIVGLTIENQIRNISLVNLFTTIIFISIFSLLGKIYNIIKEKILIESTTINKLKEGDLLVYNYYYSKNKIQLIKPVFFTKIKMLFNNTYFKDLKVDSSKACGITKEDILFLKGMYKNNLIGTKIYLKKTIAFIPAVLLGYILAIII